MKKHLKVIVVSMMIFSTVALSFAQGSSDKLGDQSKLIKTINKPLTFVFIPKVIHPWYDVVREGALAAAEEFKKMGITVNIKFDAPTNADISEQMKKIEANIGARPDGLAIAALDPATNTQLINDAIKARLNVITFDTDAPNSNRPLYVGHSKDFQDGYDLGEYLAKLINYKGKVGILSGSLTAPNHVGRVKGFKEAIAKYSGISIVFERPDNDDLQKAVELTENALQANSDLVGIFGCNASNPIGAARAVKAAGKTGKVHIVGMDDLPETLQLIKEGVIDATKAQRQWEIGYWAVKYLVAMNQNHTIPAVHETGSRLITKNDL
jgi:ribose transport system substrate-binding protein